MDEIKEREKHAEVLRAENDELDQELLKAQKRRAIAEAKEYYGRDWRKMIGKAVGGVKNLRVKAETMHNLHSLGFGGSELRDLSNPGKWRKG